MVFFLNLKLEDCFHLPLDDRAYDQFLQLQSDLGSLSLSQEGGFLVLHLEFTYLLCSKVLQG